MVWALSWYWTAIACKLQLSSANSNLTEKDIVVSHPVTISAGFDVMRTSSITEEYVK